MCSNGSYITNGEYMYIYMVHVCAYTESLLHACTLYLTLYMYSTYMYVHVDTHSPLLVHLICMCMHVFFFISETLVYSLVKWTVKDLLPLQENYKYLTEFWLVMEKISARSLIKGELAFVLSYNSLS